MDNALIEFSKNGYNGSSVNNIYDAKQGISKGLIYHYFESKDALFLSCVEECFLLLRSYMEENLEIDPLSMKMKECFESYYKTRRRFFDSAPLYQRIFFEAVMIPPSHLKEEIQRYRQPMQKFNIEILKQIFANAPIRPDLNVDDVSATFVRFIHFMDAQYASSSETGMHLEAYEERDMKLLDIFLYGILENTND